MIKDFRGLKFEKFYASNYCIKMDLGALEVPTIYAIYIGSKGGDMLKDDNAMMFMCVKDPFEESRFVIYEYDGD